jgi:hypothetical protein
LVEAEIRSEKDVSHAVLEQTIRNGAAINVLRSDVERLTADMAVVKSELHSHGPRLDALTRDAGLLRNDATALRRDIEAMNARLDRIEDRLDRMDTEAAARHAELLAAIRATPPA